MEMDDEIMEEQAKQLDAMFDALRVVKKLYEDIDLASQAKRIKLASDWPELSVALKHLLYGPEETEPYV